MAVKRPPKSARPKPTVEEFLSGFNPSSQRLAGRLRSLIKQTIPGVTEAVYPGWKLIGYRTMVGSKDVYIGFIAPFQDRVVLGFEWGVLLADPKGLLEGNGSQVRQITVRRPGDIRPKEFKALIAEAVQVTALPKAEKARLLMEREEEREARTRPA